jgi:branched-chain amino acid transport system permease protein
MSAPQSFSMKSSSLVPMLVLCLGLALVPVVALLTKQGHWISLFTQMMILALAALSLDLILGVGGLLSFGHAAFIGLGAYVTGILIQEGRGDLMISLPLTLLVSGCFAYVTGTIALRTRGVVFIMITLAFGQMAFFAAQALYAYGGDDGLTLDGRSTVFGLKLLNNKTTFYYLTWFFLSGAMLLLYRLSRSRFGRVLLGARDNPVRMESLGYDVFRVRLMAYVISGMIAGLAGFLLANHTEFVSPAYAAWQRSGDLIFMVIIGGVGSLWGAVGGALTYLLLEEGLSGLTEHWKVIFGPLIILFVLLTHGGIAGVMARCRDLMGRSQS